MRTLIAVGIGMLVMAGRLAAEPPTQQVQPGLGEQIGEQLDRGVEQLGHQLQRGWAEVRQTVDRMGVQGRVYGRLHWDKALTQAAIDIEVQGQDVVVLTGTVPDDAARRTAVKLAQDTVGVRQVMDKLAIAPPTPASSQPYAPGAGEK
jgi:hyperosmotically inducible protein